MFLDNPLSSIFRDFIKIRTEQLETYDQQAFLIQKTMLLWIVWTSQKTHFGRIHKFSKIRSIKDFQKNVPVAHYADFQKDIKKMMHGEKNILWPRKIHYFTKSSATTGDSKYIPVSKSALLRCHFKGGKDLLAFYLRANPETKIFSGKALSLCGTFYPFPDNPDIEVGDISAILTKNLPLPAQLFRFPAPELALRDSWEAKIEEISALALTQNITAIIGVPMWTIVFIKKVLEKSGKKSILEVWPNLEVFMHGGISFKPYRPIFDELFGQNKIKYIESYNASEGYFAIQDDLSKPGEMRLMLDYGIFYEFIPILSYEKGDYKDVCIISKVEVGVNYVMVITTNAGLWRYVIGDTVMFTSLSPYRIKITGRTKQYLNLYDEEITMDNVEHAIAQASQETNSHVENFTMCPTLPDKNGRGYHEWVIEFIKVPKDLKKFANEIDRVLVKENGDYASRRVKNIVLNKPLIHVVPEGTFYNWMKSKNRLGGQFKVQRVSNSREYVDGILKFIGL